MPATIVTIDPASLRPLRCGARPGDGSDLDPIVMVGDHEAERGILRFDPENLTTADADALVDVFRRCAG